MNRAYSLLHVKDVGQEGDFVTIRGIASTPRTDRIGDIVEPLGAKFAVPMPLLWQHKHDQPVGHVTFAQPTADGIPFTAQLPNVREPGRLKERVDEAIQSLRYRLIGAVSIGFKAVADKVEQLKGGGLRFKEWEWFELSLVTIPANVDATIQMVKSYDEQQRALSGLDAPAVVRLDAAPGVPGTKPATEGSHSATIPKGTNMRTATEQVSALEAKRAAHMARIGEVMNKTAEEGRSTTQEEAEETDRLTADVKTIDSDLVRWRTVEQMQKANAAAITPQTGQDPEAASAARGGAQPQGVSTVMMRDNLPKGMEFVRHVKVEALARLTGGDPYQLSKSMYPDMHRLHQVFEAQRSMGMSIQKANVTAVSTGGAGVGALAQYQLYQGDFIEFLRPRTIVGQFGTNGVPALRRVPFMVSIPRQLTGGTGYWVGEGKPKPLTNFTHDRVTLPFHKVANIAVVTEEMLRLSTPSVEGLLRDALAAAIIETMDTSFIDPDFAGVSGVSPASITYGATGVAASGTDNNAVISDFAARFDLMLSNNMPTSGLVAIMPASIALRLSLARNELGQRVNDGLTINGGSWNGIPVIVSEHMAGGGGLSPASGGLIVIVNANEIYLADDGQVTIDVSREASLQMLDNPTNDVTTPTATSVVSLWQTDSVGFRAERFVSWMRRRDNAVTYITGAAYTGLPAA
jgi:HK97 family phage major capsid protein/HK97 family phage prohead protease